MAAPLSRRDLLKWFSAGAGAATVGSAAWLIGRDGTGDPDAGGASPADRASDTTVTPNRAKPSSTGGADASPAGQRVLVVVDMPGGSDGMSMVVPHGISGYYDLRPTTAVPAEEVLDVDGELGYHPRLAGIRDRGAAMILGVGAAETDGSHFEMQARWWEGSPNRTGAFDTGFLGRLADVIADPDVPVTAMAIGPGAHPTMIAARASTLTVPNAQASGYLTGAASDDLLLQRFQRGYRAFGNGTGTDFETRRRHIAERTVAFAEAAGTYRTEDNPFGYGDDQLGGGLRMAAHLFDQDLGLRIVHISMDGDFDTHEGHPWRHDENMAALDRSVDAFFRDIEARGLADRVLLATATEFGRTAAENGSTGLDHGWANNHLLMGPVHAGRFGEHPKMAGVDEQGGGFAPTVGLDSYLATLAQGWFGVPASEVLDGNPEPLDGVLVS
jgi:uncharacterized protein (DUF1501 family)